MITAGPRQGQVLWDHTVPKFGQEQQVSGWSTRSDFWHSNNPDNSRSSEHYPIMRSDGLVGDGGDGSRRSVSHHDLWLSEGEIVARSVDVGKSPPNPVLEVDFGNVLVDNDERLVLTEDHILVEDVDTLDASKITLRVSGVREARCENSLPMLRLFGRT